MAVSNSKQHLVNYHPLRRDNVFNIMSVCYALSFESFELECPFFGMQVIRIHYIGQVHISRSSGQGQGHGS